MNVLYKIDRGVAVITLCNPPVNALSGALRIELLASLERAETDPSITAVMLCGDGGVFGVGADIREMGTPSARLDPSVRRLHDVISAFKKPTLAAIQGNALGGSLELALACDLRIAEADAQLGLPEVNLGILPGAGGTQRLPHLVGAEVAADLLTTGRFVSAAHALALGLIDKIVSDVRADGVELAAEMTSPKRPGPRRPGAQAPASATFAALRAAIDHTTPGFAAPLAILECIEAAYHNDQAIGLALETAKLQELRRNPQHNALRHLFLAERSARRTPHDVGEAEPAAVVFTCTPDCADGISSINVAEERSAPRLDRHIFVACRACAARACEAAGADSVIICSRAAPPAPPRARDNVVTLGLSAPAGPLNHIVYGRNTRPSAVADAAWFARRLGAPVVFSRDVDPFARLWATYSEAADTLLFEGVDALRLSEVTRRFGMRCPPVFSKEGERPLQTMARTTLSDREILKRLLAPTAAAGALAVEQGHVRHADDIDVAWVHGYGFPRYHGGPMYWSAVEDRKKPRT